MVTVDNIEHMVDEAEISLAKYRDFDDMLWDEDGITEEYRKHWNTERHYCARKGLEKLVKGYKLLLQTIKANEKFERIKTMIFSSYFDGDRSPLVRNLIALLDEHMSVE